MKTIQHKRFIIVSILCILIAIICKITYENVKAKRWIEDIDYVVTTLNKTHPNMYLKTSKENFDKSIRNLKGDVKNLKDYEIELRLQEILATLRDLHTNIDTPKLRSKIYPLYLKWFKDKLIVLGADKNLKSILGKELVKINDIPVKDILKEINKLPSYEIEQNLKYYNSQMITWHYVLRYYGIVHSEIAKFTFKEGSNEQTININPIENLAYDRLSKLRDLSPKKPIRSTYKKEVDDQSYWYRYMKEDKILYFRYNHCTYGIETKGKEVKHRFEEFSTEFGRAVSKKNFNKLIIDLRYNRGGRSEILNNLYGKLQSELSKVKTYIFVGPETVSAGIINSISLKAWYPNKVIVLGKKPGQPLKFYGAKHYTFPNSKISLSCSAQAIDLTLYGVTIPEIYIEETLNDYKNGIDPLYEWVKKDKLY